MRKLIFAIVAVLTVTVLCWALSSSAQAPNSCLECHGSAEKLKALIRDEDFNKPAGAEGFG